MQTTGGFELLSAESGSVLAFSQRVRQSASPEDGAQSSIGRDFWPTAIGPLSALVVVALLSSTDINELPNRYRCRGTALVNLQPIRQYRRRSTSFVSYRLCVPPSKSGASVNLRCVGAEQAWESGVGVVTRLDESQPGSSRDPTISRTPSLRRM